jgi:hypothetical protein
MIVLEKGNYISRVWFFGKPDAELDVLVCLSRKLPAERWDFRYRFRYHVDDEAFDSKDRKSETHFSLAAEVTEAEVLEKVAVLLAALKAKLDLDMDEVIIESDEPLVFIERTKGKSWVNMRVEPVPS